MYIQAAEAYTKEQHAGKIIFANSQANQTVLTLNFKYRRTQSKRIYNLENCGKLIKVLSFKQFSKKKKNILATLSKNKLISIIALTREKFYSIHTQLFASLYLVSIRSKNVFISIYSAFVRMPEVTKIFEWKAFLVDDDGTNLKRDMIHSH